MFVISDDNTWRFSSIASHCYMIYEKRQQTAMFFVYQND